MLSSIKIMLVTALVCLSAAGCSKLEKLSVESEGVTIYLELETINRVVDDETAFIIVDFQEPKGPAQSMKYKVFVDCKNNITEMIAAYAFSGRMGQGNALALLSHSEDDWMRYSREEIEKTLPFRYPQKPKSGSAGAKVISTTCSPMSLKERAVSLIGL